MTRDMSPTATASLTRYPYIDALRGVAILGVVAVHTSQAVAPANEALTFAMKQGANCVQLFFVVSAVALCLSWEARTPFDREFAARNFWIRRFARIAPMFYLAALFHLAVDGLQPRFWAPDGVTPLAIPLSAVFAHGFHPNTINAIVPGGWSIAAEAMFYVVFPLLFGCARKIAVLLLLLSLSIAVYALNKVALGGWLVTFYPTSQSYMVVAFTSMNFLGLAPVFVMGVMTFVIVSRRQAGELIAMAAAGVLCGLGIAVAIAGRPVVNMLLHPLAWGVWFGLLVIVVARWQPVMVVNPFVEWLGKISYSMYFLHFVVLDFSARLRLQPDGPPDNLASLLFFLAVVAITALLSAATYRWIEQPGIEMGRRLVARLNSARVPAASSR